MRPGAEEISADPRVRLKVRLDFCRGYAQETDK